LKKITIIVLVGLISASILAGGLWVNKTYAIDKISSLMLNDTFDEAKEKPEVSSVFVKDLPHTKQLIKQDPTMLSKENQKNYIDRLPENMGQPYKVYQLSREDVAKFEKSQSLVLSQYLWEVPLLDKNNNIVSTITAWKFNDKWEIAQSGLNINEELVKLSSDPKLIAQFLIDKGITDVKSIKHLRIPLAFMDAFYITLDSGEELLIPLKHRMGLEIEDMKIYPIEGVMKEINLKFPTQS